MLNMAQRGPMPADYGSPLTGWHVLVDGDAPLDIDIRFPVTIEQMGDVSPG
jgi:hypothetical protein